MNAHALKPFWPLLLALVVLLLMAAFSGCYMDNEEDLYPKDTSSTGCDTASVTYSGRVKTIMSEQCATAGCHAGSAPAAGYNLETHAGVAAIATSGRLLGTIRHESGFSPMPKNASKMDDCSINQIAAWVADGAPNN